MTADTKSPPALFDFDEAGELTPPIFEPSGYAVALTSYGRHHGLGPGHGFGAPCCDEARYGAIESLGRRVWIYHVCSRTRDHDEHKCDRCDETWDAA